MASGRQAAAQRRLAAKAKLGRRRRPTGRAHASATCPARRSRSRAARRAGVLLCAGSSLQRTLLAGAGRPLRGRRGGRAGGVCGRNGQRRSVALKNRKAPVNSTLPPPGSTRARQPVAQIGGRRRLARSTGGAQAPLVALLYYAASGTRAGQRARHSLFCCARPLEPRAPLLRRPPPRFHRLFLPPRRRRPPAPPRATRRAPFPPAPAARRPRPHSSRLRARRRRAHPAHAPRPPRARPAPAASPGLSRLTLRSALALPCRLRSASLLARRPPPAESTNYVDRQAVFREPSHVGPESHRWRFFVLPPKRLPFSATKPAAPFVYPRRPSCRTSCLRPPPTAILQRPRDFL